MVSSNGSVTAPATGFRASSRGASEAVMAILEIVKYPEPVLSTPTEEVDVFDDGLRSLAADMIDTMYAAPGIGLAAPQVGRSERLCVIDLSVGEHEEDLLVLVNPRLVETEGEVKEEEGCLSFPDVTIAVPRPQRVVVEAQDLDGAMIRVEGDELLARCLHHEIDHLDGVLFIQRVSPLKRDLVRRRIRRRIKADDW